MTEAIVMVLVRDDFDYEGPLSYADIEVYETTADSNEALPNGMEALAVLSSEAQLAEFVRNWNDPTVRHIGVQQ